MPVTVEARGMTRAEAEDAETSATERIGRRLNIVIDSEWIVVG